MCDCIAEIEQKLHPFGRKLVTTLFGTPKVSIECYQSEIRKRGTKKPVVLATYCPFCGEKYAEPIAGRSEPSPIPAHPEPTPNPPPAEDPEDHT